MTLKDASRIGLRLAMPTEQDDRHATSHKPRTALQSKPTRREDDTCRAKIRRLARFNANISHMTVESVIGNVPVGFWTPLCEFSHEP